MSATRKPRRFTTAPLSEWALPLREAKERLGLTVGQVARCAGLPYMTTWRVLLGAPGVRVKGIRAVAAVLGLRVVLMVEPGEGDG
jgi:hypothetical protein